MSRGSLREKPFEGFDTPTRTPTRPFSSRGTATPKGFSFDVLGSSCSRVDICLILSRYAVGFLVGIMFYLIVIIFDGAR